MFRFFADKKDISSEFIKLSIEDSKHIRTLRLRPDEHFIVCDGNGTEYICKLGSIEKTVTAMILDEQKSLTEPTVVCKVFMAFSKGDRLDYAVQKSVELGVSEIVLFKSERCVAVPNDIPKKVTRLERIALETAKLCNRGIIPSVSATGSFDTAIDEAHSKSDLTMFFYESEEHLHIKNVLNEYFSKRDGLGKTDGGVVSVITGPEGGFTKQEAELARSKDIPVVSLGPRILRSETSPVVALAAIMYRSDNM